MTETYYLRTELCHCALSPAVSSQYGNIIECLKRYKIKELPICLKDTLMDNACPVFSRDALTVFTSCYGIEKDDHYLKQHGIKFDSEANEKLREGRIRSMQEPELDYYRKMARPRELIDLEEKMDEEAMKEGGIKMSHSLNGVLGQVKDLEPDLSCAGSRKKGIAKAGLQQIYDSSGWYSARYAAGDALAFIIDYSHINDAKKIELNRRISIWIGELDEQFAIPDERKNLETLDDASILYYGMHNNGRIDQKPVESLAQALIEKQHNSHPNAKIRKEAGWKLVGGQHPLRLFMYDHPKTELALVLASAIAIEAVVLGAAYCCYLAGPYSK